VKFANAEEAGICLEIIGGFNAIDALVMTHSDDQGLHCI
jgi:hypothetical protein